MDINSHLLVLAMHPEHFLRVIQGLEKGTSVGSQPGFAKPS